MESTESWLRATLTATGTGLEERRLVEAAAALEVAGALPGGTEPVHVPPELATVWAERDLGAASHRAAIPADVADDADGDPVSAQFSEDLGRVGVRSPCGGGHGAVVQCVDAYVLSYEHGVGKPDPRLFAAACAELGVAPEHTLMVGDSRTADGGAAALGCQVHFVDHLPVRDRPDALLPVLDLVQNAELPPV